MLRYLSDRLHHLLRKQKLAYRLEMLLSVSTGRVFLDTVSPAPQFTEAYKAFQEVVDNYVQVLLKYGVFHLKKLDSTLCLGDFLWYSEAVIGVKSSNRVGALTFRQEN